MKFLYEYVTKSLFFFLETVVKPDFECVAFNFLLAALAPVWAIKVGEFRTEFGEQIFNHNHRNNNHQKIIHTFESLFPYSHT
jgi:hypothetical protein